MLMPMVFVSCAAGRLRRERKNIRALFAVVENIHYICSRKGRLAE